jgi:NADPH2 dehydrogenase
MKMYYAQRASVPGTLLVSEGTYMTPEAGGYDFVPGLWEPAMLREWKKITDAVHAKGSYIYCQLWCLGRAARPKVMEKNGLEVLSSSNLPIDSENGVPRAMTEDEIWAFVGYYATAARRAVFEAGFDGVEIHGANGYMVDQFTQDTCNNRTDKWGGSVENRARFALEVARACVAAVGADRVGIRLSPYSEYQGMRMADPAPQFSYLIRELGNLGLSYLHMTTPRVQGALDVKNPTEDMGWAVEAWGKERVLILAGGYRLDSAKSDIDVRFRDYNLCIAWGRWFISTPDLPFRLRKGIEVNKYDRATFYTAMSDKGYTDYPFSREWEDYAQDQSRL